MRRVAGSAVPLAAAALLAAGAALPVAGSTRARAEDAAPVSCGNEAASYAGGKGVSLWVTRRGTLTRENPLRPLTPDLLQVLEVVIRGKAATAYGPDLDNLRRGGAPASLEAQSGPGAAIRWGAGLDGLPKTLRILQDDGAGVVAALPFRACGEAPKVATPKVEAPKGASSKGASSKGASPGAAKDAGDARPGGPSAASAPTGRAKPARKADEPAGRLPNGFTLPQGAIE
ncbi:hypothetical protein [Methylobacterium sp. WSM2598]|uniref:hypothetical protein n=1 Tax=Methylobacterium sp. WSM2598 TaxID=398261 RepID=UPI0003729B1B|nr:hypothetical protein [Methylobacterium sp. WSM2598]